MNRSYGTGGLDWQGVCRAAATDISIGTGCLSAGHKLTVEIG
jgi:hypothetical protein